MGLGDLINEIGWGAVQRFEDILDGTGEPAIALTLTREAPSTLYPVSSLNLKETRSDQQNVQTIRGSQSDRPTLAHTLTRPAFVPARVVDVL